MYGVFILFVMPALPIVLIAISKFRKSANKPFLLKSAFVCGSLLDIAIIFAMLNLHKSHDAHWGALLTIAISAPWLAIRLLSYVFLRHKDFRYTQEYQPILFLIIFDLLLLLLIVANKFFL
jgi:amino acid transporter